MNKSFWWCPSCLEEKAPQNVTYQERCVNCGQPVILKELVMQSYIERLERKLGYQDGFDDGLQAARYCASCEYCPKCQDDNSKTIYCPYSKLKNEFVT